MPYSAMVADVPADQLQAECWTVTGVGAGQVAAAGDPAVSHFPAWDAAAAFRDFLAEAYPAGGPYGVERLPQRCHVARCAGCRAVFDEAGSYGDVDGWAFHFGSPDAAVEAAAGTWARGEDGRLLCSGCDGGERAE